MVELSPEPVYPWYAIVGESQLGRLEQGDIIPDCEVGHRLLKPNEAEYDPKQPKFVKTTLPLGIILSQSCDLVAGKLQTVQICPVFTLDEFVKNDTSKYFLSTKAKEELRRGNLPGYHMLNRCDLEGHVRGPLVCDFRSLVSVPFEPFHQYATSIKARLRLLPPYREHLAQALARFFMRVGLPTDIPAFKYRAGGWVASYS